MKYSTGRGTGCRHSTSMEWDEVERKQRSTVLGYSTGKGSPLRHSCGVLLDGEISEEKNQADCVLPLVEEEEREKETKRKYFRRVVADY